MSLTAVKRGAYIVSARLLLILGLVAGTATCGTLTLFNNFSEDPSDPGWAYKDPVNGYLINWNQDWNWPSDGIHPYGSAEAMPFTPGQDAYLVSIAMAMYKWPDNNPVTQFYSVGTNHDNLTIELVDSTGNLPNEAAVIEVLSVNPSIAEDDFTYLHLNSLLHPHLLQGHTYWILAKPTVYNTSNTNDNTVYAWIRNNEGTMWNYTVNQFNPFNNGGFWQGFFSQSNSFLSPTLQVIGSDAPAPEPDYIAATPLVAFAVWAWKKRKDSTERRVQVALRRAIYREERR